MKLSEVLLTNLERDSNWNPILIESCYINGVFAGPFHKIRKLEKRLFFKLCKIF